jgi:hypothetical protein
MRKTNQIPKTRTNGGRGEKQGRSRLKVSSSGVPGGPLLRWGGMGGGGGGVDEEDFSGW